MKLRIDQECRRLYEEMLFWPEGSRQTDGIWGRHWYGSAEISTGFHPYVKKHGNLSSKYKDIYTSCLENYEILYKYCLK